MHITSAAIKVGCVALLLMLFGAGVFGFGVCLSDVQTPLLGVLFVGIGLFLLIFGYCKQEEIQQKCCMCTRKEDEPLNVTYGGQPALETSYTSRPRKVPANTPEPQHAASIKSTKRTSFETARIHLTNSDMDFDCDSVQSI